MAYTGIRGGTELHGLKWGDIDFEKRQIKISSKIAKGGKKRTCGLTYEAEAALKELLSVEHHNTIPSKETPLVKNGYNALHRAFTDWIKEYLDAGQAGKPHGLRSYCINWLWKDKGMPIERISIWLGASVAVLMKHYADKNEEVRNKEWVEELYSNEKAGGRLGTSVPKRQAEAS